MDIPRPPHSSTQMQQSQVAQTAQMLVLMKATDIQPTRTLAMLHALPLNGWQRTERSDLCHII